MKELFKKKWLKKMIPEDSKKSEITDDSNNMENVSITHSSSLLIHEKTSDENMNDRWASIGQLSAGIAHEINNPLGFIENNLFVLQLYVSKFTKMIDYYNLFRNKCDHILELKDDIDELKEHEQTLKIKKTSEDLETLFQETQEGINRMTTIIKSLKNFAQMENTTQMIPFNINTGLANTLIICQNEHKYHADIQAEYGDIPEIRCDPGQINQVFLNILVNASHAVKAKFKDKRGEIRIQTATEGNRIICTISDNGIGIPEHIKKSIFDPFFTTKDPKVGTGLGLSISYNIIRQHNGDITLKSTPGEGATFTISLPIIE